MITAKEIIQQSWKLYEENFKLVIKVIVWGFLASIFSSVGIFLLDLFFKGGDLVRTFLELLVNLPQIVIAVWVGIVLIDLLNNLLSKKKVNLSDSINKGFYFYLPILILSVIVALIETAGFILLIVPGLIFTVWFAFSNYEIILAGKGVKEAMISSKGLSKNIWWQVAWRYFAPGVFWGLAGWVTTSVLVFAINQLLVLTNTTLSVAGNKILFLIYSISQNAFYIFFVPLIVASVLLLYKDLKGGKT